MDENIPLLVKEPELSICSRHLPDDLHSAIMTNNVEEFENILLRDHIDVNGRYDDEMTLLELCCAMRGNCDKLVTILLKHRADQNVINPSSKKVPIHSAAQNENLETLRILVEHPKTEFDIKDSDGNTALHYAVLHPESEKAVKLLINTKANFDVLNCNRKTPLHIAMEKKNEEVIKLLIAAGADLMIEGPNGTTIREQLKQSFPNLNIHPNFDKKSEIFSLLIKGKFDKFRTEIKANKNFLDKSHGSLTLLQYCCKYNLEDIVKELLELGANPNAKTTYNQNTPIMLAASNGRPNIVEILIKCPDRVFNEVEEQNALHGIIEGIQFHTTDDSNYLICMEHLLKDKWKRFINHRDDCKRTVLYCAARLRYHDMVLLLLKYGAYIGAESISSYVCKYISYDTFLEYLDRCISDNEFLPGESNYQISFNYDFLLPFNLTMDQKGCSDVENNLPCTEFLQSETKPLLDIANNRELRGLLKHPIFTSFLHLKWYKIQYLFFFNAIFYLLFWLFLTIYILNDYTFDRNHNSTKTLNDENINSYNSKYNLTWFIVILLFVLLIIRESFQFFLGPKKYILNPENWLEICLIIVTIVILCSDNINIKIKHQLSAICIMLSSVEFILLLGQYPTFSVNIEMFKTVILNFLTFFAWYSILIIAFALSFYTLFKDTKYDDNEANFFFNGWISTFKTIVMLTGEFDAGTIPFSENPIFSHVLFVLFVFLIAIVFFNLLNGLAVSDTHAIRSDAELVSIISRVKLILYLENILINPSRLLKLCKFTKYLSINLTDTLTSDHKIHVLVNNKAEITIKPINGNNSNTKSQSGTEIQMKRYMDPKIVEKAEHILANRKKTLERESEKSKQSFNDMENCKQELKYVKAKLEENQNLLKRMCEKLENEK